jgi:hypothetical protein
MDNPTSEIIDELGIGECLMAALMANDPETGKDKASGESVEGPERKAGDGIKDGRGKKYMLGGE